MESQRKNGAADQDIAAACQIARQIVAEQWPDLAQVEPTVTPRQLVHPSMDLLARAGVTPNSVVFVPDGTMQGYTFTFAAETPTPDGHMLPCVARVTVDAQQRVVKTTLSK